MTQIKLLNKHFVNLDLIEGVSYTISTFSIILSINYLFL